MRNCIVLCLCFAMQFTYPASGPGRQGHVSSCTLPPSILSLWSPRNPSITCYVGNVSCSNTANVETNPDLGPALNTLTTDSQATAPAYTTSAIGTNPAWTFTAASTNALITSSAVVPTGSIMMYAVLKPPASGTAPIFTSNNALSSAQLNSVAWYLDATEHPTLDASFVANVFNDSAHSYASTWSELYFTNNFTTGAYTFGHVTAVGGLVQDGSGTSPQAWSNPSNAIGFYPAASVFYQGPIAEVGYNTTGSTTGLATYLACQYPTI
jgi:hypothetical protein